jgi:hypothetical protein
MALIKPLLSTQKKIDCTKEQSNSPCPESDETSDEEISEEDPEWNDEFDFVGAAIFKVRFLIILPNFFTYSAHSPEYFASISIPPPER